MPIFAHFLPFSTLLVHLGLKEILFIFAERENKRNQLVRCFIRLKYLIRIEPVFMAKIENKTKENPKLQQIELSDGRISLYLEYF